jgi:phosphoglycolate phosphatase
MIEIIHDHVERGHIRHALFDFDGTLSLIREGWQQVMLATMMDELLQTPRHEDEPQLRSSVTQMIIRTTGQTTSLQMALLAEQVHKRGGQPENPLVYKQRYLEQLNEHIHSRIAMITSGRMSPDETMVPGARAMLEAMRVRGVRCHLVSGTYEPYVLDEADVLKITPYFEGIYGGQDDPAQFSKKQFVERLVAEHHLKGREFVSIGDGAAEIEAAKSSGGIAVGVASDEAARSGMDERKRKLLIQAGADVIVPDFRDHEELVSYLFNG